MKGPIAKQIRLPGAYTISISVVSRPQPKDGAALALDEDASWNVEDQTIYLWEGLTPRQRWLKLTHEFKHAVNDYELWVRQQVGAE